MVRVRQCTVGLAFLAVWLLVPATILAGPPEYCVSTSQVGSIPAAQIVSVNADAGVWARFCGGTAGYTSDAFLAYPGYQYIGTGNVTPEGTLVDLGVFAAGTELVFAITVRNSGYTYYTGPSSRNPDGVVHAAVTDLGDGNWHIGFEDMWGGGDADYDDINLVINAEIIVVPPGVPDTDEDGIPDDQDNCVVDPNPDQANYDGDAFGDVCDPCPYDAENDADGDGVCADQDNCPFDTNPWQEDTDGDGYGDVCDLCPFDAENDGDGDGVCGDIDNCPGIANSDQLDSDQDGAGDACDPCAFDPDDDIDQDGFCGDVDNCPDVPNPDQLDSDADGLGEACDTCPFDPENDADGDGVCGDVDLCPGTILPDEAAAVRLGTNRFADIDGDGVFDTRAPKGHGPGRSYTIEATGGCSCAQIIVALHAGKGHWKFGCSIGVMEKWLSLAR